LTIPEIHQMSLLGFCPVFNRADLEELHHSFETPLRTFFWHCADVHQAAICRRSSIYAATEIFICDHAGQSVVLTAFAMLQEKYDSTPSPASEHPFTPGFRAAQDDLVFGFAITGLASDTQSLCNFVHPQSLCNQVGPERTKRALWNLSRSTPDSHMQDSTTYVSCQRPLMEPGSGWERSTDLLNDCQLTIWEATTRNQVSTKISSEEYTGAWR
jgi:hypothetical protein